MINMLSWAFKTDYFYVIFKLYKTDGAFVLLLIIQIELFNIVLHGQLTKIIDIQQKVLFEIDLVKLGICVIYEMPHRICHNLVEVHVFVIFVVLEEAEVLPEFGQDETRCIHQVCKYRIINDHVSQVRNFIVSKNDSLLKLLLHISNLSKILLLIICQFSIECLDCNFGHMRRWHFSI